MAERIQGRETSKYSFEYDSDEINDQILKLDPKKDADKISELKGKIKFLNYEIQHPTFDEIVASLSQIGVADSAGLIGCGKVIWELCCVSFDKEIERNPIVLVSVCLRLAREYSLPISIELKKK